MSTPGPNWFIDRAPWLVILFGGTPALAALTKINGLSTKDEWKKQKSKEASGQSKVFAGTTVGDPKLTFEATTAEEYQWLLDHWEQLKPVPVPGGGSTASAKPPAVSTTGGKPQTITTPGGTVVTVTAANAKQVFEAKKSGDFSVVEAHASDGGDEPDANADTSAKSEPSPGPRPPTLSVDYPWLLFHGITAVARAEWEGPSVTATNSVEVTITYSVQDPPKPAGVGTMAPAAASAPVGSQFAIGSGKGGPGGGAVAANAAGGAAGT